MSLTGRLLAQLAHVAWADAEALHEPYAWPPRTPLTEAELHESDRLRVLSHRLAYKARELGCVDQGTDALFGAEPVADDEDVFNAWRQIAG